MAYFTAPAHYQVIREMSAGVGFADLVLISRKNAGALKDYTDNILLAGISYDKDSVDKKHHVVIEEVKV